MKTRGILSQHAVVMSPSSNWSSHPILDLPQLLGSAHEVIWFALWCAGQPHPLWNHGYLKSFSHTETLHDFPSLGVIMLLNMQIVGNFIYFLPQIQLSWLKFSHHQLSKPLLNEHINLMHWKKGNWVERWKAYLTLISSSKWWAIAEIMLWLNCLMV